MMRMTRGREEDRRRAGGRTGEEMAAEKVRGGGGSERASGGEEMNGSSSEKVVVGGGGAGGYRENGDCVPLKRRLVGLSNGGRMSDGGNSEEEEDDRGDEVEVAAEEVSEDYDEGREGDLGLVAGKGEEEETNGEDGHLVAAVIGRGGGSSSRVRELVRYEDDDFEMMEDDGYDEEPAVPDSPVDLSRGREQAREVSFPEDGRDLSDHSDDSDDSDDEMALPVSRGIVELGQTSARGIHHREVAVVPEKPARGMIDTAKMKAEVTPQNGVARKPKKEKAPAAPRKKANKDGPSQERMRFSTEDKVRMTLERAREILAAVNAEVMKDPRQFSRRHAETHTAAENSPISDDDRVPMQPPPSRVSQQVQPEEKSAKKRGRAPKGEKEPTPGRRKPNLEVEYHAAKETSFYRGPHVEGPGHDHGFKLGLFSTTGHEFEGRDREGYEKTGYLQDVYEQQVTVVEKVRKWRNKKEGENPSATGLVPGGLLKTEGWVPPESPFGLIQESLYHDPWKVLLSCMLLNKSHKTAGWQVYKVIWDLLDLCPDAETAINIDTAKIAEKVYSFGLQNKRAKMIQRFSDEYLRGKWTNVTQLHGIGKHAADAYAIFCQGLWREVEPDDQQLSKYWKWLWETNGLGSAFTGDAS